MREKLMTLPLKELQQIAKANHIRYTGLRKAELVDRLCMLDEGQSDPQTEKTEAENAPERSNRARRTYGAGAPEDRENEAVPERSSRARRTYGAGAPEGRENGAVPERSSRARRPYGAGTSENRGNDAAPERSNRARKTYGADPARDLESDGTPERTWHPRRQYERRTSEYQTRGVTREEPQEIYREKEDDPDTYTPVEELHQEYTDPAEELQKSYAAIAEEEPDDVDEEAADYGSGETGENGMTSEGGTADAKSPAESRSDENRAQAPEGESSRNDADPPRRTRTFSYESDEETCGILEIMPDGYGFIRCHNYLPGEEDVYVAPSQIRKFNLQTGDFLRGKLRVRREGERFGALAFLEEVNNASLAETAHRIHFEDLTPIFPDKRIYLETNRRNLAMRIVDIVSPVGKGQRGMIVSPPKAGKTTLLKEIARSVTFNYPDIHLIILLIDERPEEVTDIKEAIQGENVEVIYSTFDELPEHHKRVSEMAIERAKRLVEQKKDVMVLLDSITRLARAYNLTIAPSGRTLSGGLDPAALYMPKKFFGAARNIREGGSLTILATALIETGSRMDDMIFEEFKGTGNMELVLDRRLSERRVFPAIDLLKSGTRRDDLIMTREEKEASDIIRRLSNSSRQDDMLETVMNLFYQTRDNQEFIRKIKVTRL